MATHGSVSPFVQGKEDWTSYVERMDHYFKANGVNEDPMKCSILLSACGAKTYKLIKSLVKDIDSKTFKELTDEVKKHYDPTPSKIMQRYKFNTRVRAEGETIAAYVAALREIAEYCHYTDLDEMLRDRLVCGVRHQNIQQRLLTEKDLSFEAAYQIAESMEAAERDARRLGGSKGSSDGEAGPVQFSRKGKHSSYSGKKKPTASKEGRSPICYRCGENHLAPDCRFKDAICSYCKKKGHISKACKAKAKRARQSSTHYHGQSESEEEDQSYPCLKVSGNTPGAMLVDVHMNSIPVTMEFDTGASFSLINSETYKRISQESEATPLNPARIKLTTYTGEKIKLLGATTVDVRYGDSQTDILIYVADGDGPNLMGRDLIYKFNVSLSDVCNVVQTTESLLEEVLNKHSEVFNGNLGTVKGFQAKLYVDPEAQPKFCKARTVPYAMKQLVEAELKRLEEDGVITPIQFSKWAAPIVPVMKKDGSVRICGDYKVSVNPALQVDPYPLPRVDELFASLSGGQHFTKLDLSRAYLQMELDEESKQYCVINTHKGLFKVNRLPFGVASAPSLFQRCMETLLKDCKGVTVYIDDILVTGSTAQEHLQNLDRVLEKLAVAGIKLKRSKCKFLMSRVEYLGHVIDKNGLHPSQEKVKAIHDAPTPKNVTELRSFLGILNYYGKFLPNLSTQLAPLHVLLQKKAKWSWGTAQNVAFQAAKKMLTADTLLVHYDGSKPLILACDASPVGVGAVLSHVINGVERPVAYASRTLTAAEKNYSQLEKEGLAVIFGVRKFHNYLWGRHFSIESDHQPLSHLFGEFREIPPLASARIQRWALLLSAYQYSIKYKPGKNLGNADALSRLPQAKATSPDPVPGEHVFLVNHLAETAINSSNIKHWTERDPTLSKVHHYLRQGKPNQLGDEFKPCLTRWKELSVMEGCVLWGSRVIVPPQGRQLVLEELHETHPGVSRMKALARSYIWWPNMDADIERVVHLCEDCQAVRPAPPAARLHPWEWPAQPWSRLHLDFAGPFQGHMFLILVDAHSKWLDAQIMSSITSTKTIEKLKMIFSTHGLPQKIVTDNGPSFTSEEFKKFVQSNGIKHVTSAPYHPATNGLAERAVQTVKQGLRQIKGGSVQEKLSRFLFKYRITPHTTTGVAPSELLMGHRLRSRLDLLHPDLSETVANKQQKQKKSHANRPDRQFSVGDTVYAEDFTVSSERWLPGVVKKVTGPRSYLIELADGRSVRRHVDAMRERKVEFPQATRGEGNWDVHPPVVTQQSTGNPPIVETTPTTPVPDAQEQGSDESSTQAEPNQAPESTEAIPELQPADTDTAVETGNGTEPEQSSLPTPLPRRGRTTPTSPATPTSRSSQSQTPSPTLPPVPKPRQSVRPRNQPDWYHAKQWT